MISIQSQVVHGHVGNSAAVFPMQARGIEVAAVPTTLLSNHPHYSTMRGRVLEADLVADLLKGCEERGLIETSAILLTGYLGSVEIAHVVADFVERAKRRKPDLLYVCDPVMGDDELGVFAADGLPDVFRERLAPQAAIITPNQYETEMIIGGKARSANALSSASRIISDRGTGTIVVTGCVLDDTEAGMVETILCQASALQRTATSRLAIRPAGTGDLFFRSSRGRAV